MSFARVKALVVVGVLVTSAMIFVIFAITKDHQRSKGGPTGCPKDAVIADLGIPAEKDIKVKVFDASGGTVEASSVAADLKHRGFQVEAAGPVEVSKQVAVLRYGPKGVGAAWVVKAYFLLDLNDPADTDDFQVKRDDAVVEILVGSGFQKLATSTEFKFRLGQNGRPTQPPGTCGDDTADGTTKSGGDKKSDSSAKPDASKK